MTPLAARTDLLQGTLDVLILKTLALSPMHGWGISQRIQQLSREVLQVNQGSLYPALYRLEAKGWIRSQWGNSENNRRARFYELTRSGRRQLAEETESWERFAADFSDDPGIVVPKPGMAKTIRMSIPQPVTDITFRATAASRNPVCPGV